MSKYDHLLGEAREIFPLSELAERSALSFGELPVMRILIGDEYREWNYNELNHRVRAIARWLISQGIGSGDHIAILGDNSPEWEASYLGIQAAGAICIPVDRMLPPPGISHVLSDSGSKMIFSSTGFLEIINDIREISTLKKWINFDNKKVGDSMDFEEVIAAGAKLDTPLPKRDIDEVAVILYTSGTTGHSKGVMLTSANIMSNASSAGRLYDVGPGDTFFSVLPVHHSFEATAGFIFPIFAGASITFSKSLKSADIISGIRETNVTFLLGVPLLFEKIQAGMLRGVKKKGKKTERLFKTLLGIVKFGEIFGLKLGKPLFRSVREKAGFGTLRYLLSGGGPLDPEISKFFNRLGLLLMQGYGLTETSPCTHLTPPWFSKHECVGPTLPGVESKLIDLNDQGVGEVCIRGPNVFKGYYRNEEATKETFTDDGWFKTGDLGIIDKDDYLQITGRKKAMIVTAGGKNVYPEEIEFYLNRSPFIAESVVLGVPREQGMGEEVAALIHPDYEQLDIHFEELGKGRPTDEDIHQLINKEVKSVQKNLADDKRIKTFRIFEDEFQKTTKRTIKRFLYTGEMIKVNGAKV